MLEICALASRHPSASYQALPERAEAIVVAHFDRMRLRRTFTGVIKCKIARGTPGHSVFSVLKSANGESRREEASLRSGSHKGCVVVQEAARELQRQAGRGYVGRISVRECNHCVRPQSTLRRRPRRTMRRRFSRPRASLGSKIFSEPECYLPAIACSSRRTPKRSSESSRTGAGGTSSEDQFPCRQTGRGARIRHRPFREHERTRLKRKSALRVVD
jgi:hypothetical protein